MIEGGHDTPSIQREAFEQADLLIDTLSTAHTHRFNFLVMSIFSYEMIGKQTKASVLMSKLRQTPPPTSMMDMPEQLRGGMTLDQYFDDIEKSRIEIRSEAGKTLVR